MAEISNVKRIVAFVVGFVECFLFGAIISGWPSLVYLIKEDRIYGYLCYNNSDFKNHFVNISSDKVKVSSKVCLEEENIYNLMFGFGITIQHMSTLSSAFLLECFGLRKTRFFNSLLIFSAGMLLGNTTNEHPHFLFVGIMLIAIGIGQQKLIDFQIPNLFPSAKATVLSLYVGASSSSSGVFVLFQYASDFTAIKWNISFFIYGGLSLLMLLPTFYIFPESLVQKTKDYIPNVTLDNQTENAEIVRLLDEKENEGLTSETKSQSDANKQPTFKESAISFSYIVHLCALLITSVFSVGYNGIFNWWIVQIISDADTVRWLTAMFGNLQFTTIALQPLIGFSVDVCLKKAKNAKDIASRARIERWIIFVILVVLTSVALTSLLLTFYTSLVVIQASIVFFVLTKSFLTFTHPIYIRLRFPSVHFNKLFGIAGLIVAIAAQLQHLAFLWIQKDSFTPRWTIAALLVLSFINPFHLFCLKKKVLSSE